MEAVNAGLISDMKSLIDSITGGLAKLFEVVTENENSDNAHITMTSTTTDGVKVVMKFYPEKSDTYRIEIDVEGYQKTVLKGIKQDVAEQKAFDTLKSKYGITKDMLEKGVKSSRKCIAGLQKVECSDSTDIILTGIYASQDIPINDIQAMLDSALASDELIEQISDEPIFIEISDNGSDIDIETEPEFVDQAEVERLDAIDRQNAAAVISMLANVIFMESRTRFSDSLEATQLADQIKSLADELFEAIASSVGDLDVGVGILNDRVMEQLADTKIGDAYDVYAVIRDRLDFIKFFSVNTPSNISYTLETLCTDMFDCIEKYTESVFGYADGQ